MYLSVIIPAYNEEKRLGKTLRAVHEYLKKQSYEYEILVVNDGSRDGTAALVKNVSEEAPRVKLIDNKENHGKGFVVRQGLLAAEGAVRLFMDADNSTSVDHFEKMKPFFDRGSEVVIGSRDRRDHPDARQDVPQSFLKRLAGDVGNLVIQALVVPGVWDTQCGFKAFSAKAARVIFSRARVNRWAFDVEALGLARKLGYPVEIIPVHWINDPKSHVKLSAYFQFLIEAVRIWWRLHHAS